MVEDGDGDRREILFAFLVGLAPAAFPHLGHGRGQDCGIDDRAGREGRQLGGQLRLRAAPTGEDDLAHGGRVRDAGAPHEGR